MIYSPPLFFTFRLGIIHHILQCPDIRARCYSDSNQQRVNVLLTPRRVGPNMAEAQERGQTQAPGPGVPSHPHGGGQPVGKVFGEPEKALEIFKAYKKLVLSDEIQDMYDSKMDFKNPNVIETMLVVYVYDIKIYDKGLSCSHRSE